MYKVHIYCDKFGESYTRYYIVQVIITDDGKTNTTINKQQDDLLRVLKFKLLARIDILYMY